MLLTSGYSKNGGHCFLQKKLIRCRAIFKEIRLVVGSNLDPVVQRLYSAIHPINNLFLILA